MNKSIIYFARHYTVTNNFEFKIGESGRGKQRQKDKTFPKDFYIDDFYSTPIKTKEYRLYIESFLRVYLPLHYHCELLTKKTDTFIGKDYREVLKIKHNFQNICNLAKENYEKNIGS